MSQGGTVTLTSFTWIYLALYPLAMLHNAVCTVHSMLIFLYGIARYYYLKKKKNSVYNIEHTAWNNKLDLFFPVQQIKTFYIISTLLQCKNKLLNTIGSKAAK